jgi:hypothetical protein
MYAIFSQPPRWALAEDGRAALQSRLPSVTNIIIDRFMTNLQTANAAFLFPRQRGLSFLPGKHVQNHHKAQGLRSYRIESSLSQKDYSGKTRIPFRFKKAEIHTGWKSAGIHRYRDFSLLSKTVELTICGQDNIMPYCGFMRMYIADSSSCYHKGRVWL